MAEKHTVHCRAGGKVVIDGDRVEIHLPGPIVVRRQSWTIHLSPAEEARRSISHNTISQPEKMLEEAFQAVPQVVHHEED
ncbi:hypothetical protein MUO32_26280 [Shinella sp. CPCC 101442]|uniref:hypothetical protein n=1 Tax=Shinella sp. CPCC 101442 TaxID=2932265 RepID=UPI0021526A7B|nr:hypothetical protein [Shinella sp. CPCC 101442]MCR6502539.1 hypothetical protein [Shinella sp. CPCC 101442]